MVSAALRGILRRGRALFYSYSHTHSLWVSTRLASTSVRYTDRLKLATPALGLHWH